jgi:hypothetical protein
VKEKGQGRPDQKPEAQRNAHLKEAGKLSCGLPINLQEPSPEHGEGQGEPADLNVSGPNTVYAESPEAGLNDNAPRKLRRRRSSSVGGGRLHGYGEDEIRK